LATERLFTALLDGISNNQLLTFEMLHLQFAGEAEQTILAQLQMEDIPEHPSSDTAESLLNALRKMRLASYKQKILAKIAEAAQQKDDEMLNQLIEQRILVDRELVSLSRK